MVATKCNHSAAVAETNSSVAVIYLMQLFNCLNYQNLVTPNDSEDHRVERSELEGLILVIHLKQLYSYCVNARTAEDVVGVRTYLNMPLGLKKSFRHHLASYHPRRVEPCVVFLSARNYQRINLVKSFTAHHQSALWNRSHPYSCVITIVVILEFYNHDLVAFSILSLIVITWWSHP